MLKSILSMSGLTLVSRLTGFARDVFLASVLGAGLAADALVVAMKLPNQFRAIFAEGAFNAAYVPVYTRLMQTGGREAAQAFAGRILSIILASQIMLLGLALIAMPFVVSLIAPGFVSDPKKFELTVTLTRIAFPYLAFMALVTQLTGSLNAVGRFAAGAFAPVLLNLSMIAALGLAFLFPSAAHAAAWGIVLAGILELALLMIAARQADVLPRPLRPRSDPAMRDFWRAFLPGVIGSSGVQLAILADLLIATLLPEGTAARIYYADRLYQLPVGVIAVAAGTVLLPRMTQLLAEGETQAAHAAQLRVFTFVLVLCMPFVAAFLFLSEWAMSALFVRGAFTPADGAAAAAILNAYAVGLLAVVLIRSAVAPFHARGDTKTPMLIAFGAIACNIALKILLGPRLGGPGLALATSAGAWINLIALLVVARRWGWMAELASLLKPISAIAAAGCLAALVFALGRAPVLSAMQGVPAAFRVFVALLVIGALGLAVYALAVWSLARIFKLHGLLRR